ncbi:ribosomal protein s18 alanine acetyltransferase [Reticulomyxa filosa]|uniref:Ribosomal protein s18 alanine acetyltransferase n=1 Tax=Reticulomyxa filosa TaxID=46433 RepID=X6M8W7_RETFI|nr:ribosomal protein s18 alanine acetyltransferase [Reticulomyxa filosa]|eukprot:ETO09465.1 ribosomal protein s18 alanine acetyltransferase [Reticulomyxa filosa]
MSNTDSVILPLARALSVENEHNELLPNLELPKPLRKCVSDGLFIENSKLKSHYEVRTYRVEDASAIYNIMQQTWPEHPETRNERYWTKQFIEIKKRYGFIIEEIIPSKPKDHLSAESNEDPSNDTKDDSSHDKQQVRIEIVIIIALSQKIALKKINNPGVDAKNRKVVGICMYMWNTPGPHEDWTWRETDWPSECSSDEKNSQWLWNSSTIEQNKKEFAKCAFNPNINLDKHFSLIKTHFVHITDVAIHPDYRGHDLGSQLMQTVVYSFPKGTKFGLEVETTNIAAIKCYIKSGFNIIREVI